MKGDAFKDTGAEKKEEESMLCLSACLSHEGLALLAQLNKWSKEVGSATRNVSTGSPLWRRRGASNNKGPTSSLAALT